MTQQKGTTLSGNTKFRQRLFLLTLNEKTLEFYEFVKNYLMSKKPLNYMLVVEHIGQKNKHYHIGLQFNNPVKLSIDKLYGSNVKIKKYASIQNIINYCKCEDKKHKDKGITYKLILEYGEPKFNGGFKTIKEVKKMNVEERNELQINYYNIINKINNEEREEKMFNEVLDEIKNNNLKSPEIIYITGYSGSGKTHFGYEYALTHYKSGEIGKITMNDNFINFVNKEAKCFIIEEFRPSQIKPANFLQLTDKYGYKTNIKGDNYFIRPEMIIICSIIEPFELYKNEEVNYQFIRRITKLYDCHEWFHKYFFQVDRTDLIEEKLLDKAEDDLKEFNMIYKDIPENDLTY